MNYSDIMRDLVKAAAKIDEAREWIEAAETDIRDIELEDGQDEVNEQLEDMAIELGNVLVGLEGLAGYSKAYEAHYGWAMP